MASSVDRVAGVAASLIVVYAVMFGLLPEPPRLAQAAERHEWSLHRPWLQADSDSTTFRVDCKQTVSGQPLAQDDFSGGYVLTLRQVPQTQDKPPVAKPQPDSSEPADYTRTLDVPGLGKVVCVLPRPIEQPVEKLDAKQLQQSLRYRWAKGELHWEIGWESPPAQAAVFHQHMDVPDQPRKQVLASADKTETMDLLHWLGRTKPQLARLEYVTRLEWEAGVDGQPFQPILRRRDPHAGETLQLAARPGQTVTFRATFDVTRYEVTLDGVATTINPADIDQVQVEGLKNPTEDTRRRTLTFAPIQLADWTRASLYTNFRATSPQYEHVYWRVGDPEEAWLFSGDYPLAQSVPIGESDERRMTSIVQDLNRAFNRDLNGFFLYRGYGGPHGWLDKQCVDHWSALADLDLSSASRLRDAFARLRDQTRNAELDANPAPAAFLKRHSSETKRQWWEYPPLWQPLRPREAKQGSPSWHSPGDVQRLAVLYRDEPAMRELNPLRRVLDYWVVEMPQHPDPNSITRGKGMYVVRDSSSSSQLRAIAALQIGAKLFGEKKYSELAARQRDWFRQRLIKSGAWELLDQRSGRAITLEEWQSNNPQRRIYEGEKHNELVEQIAAWGQLAVWEQNTAELDRVRNWIRTALARSDDAGRLAYAHYIGCQFEHRLSLLAVLRGRTSLLDALPVGHD